MGAFYLVSRSAGPDWKDIAVKLDSALRDQGFNVGKKFQTNNYHLGVFGKLDGVSEPQLLASEGADDQPVASCVGTMLCGGKFGIDALQQVTATGNRAVINGNYCLLTGTRDELEVRVDDLGLYKVYRSHGGSVLCSSFLALASSIRHLTLNQQCLYEYVFQGATYGGDTLFDEISILDPTETLRVGASIRTSRVALPTIPDVTDDADSLQSDILALLEKQFSQLGAAFGNSIDTALSGGYDSRLMLALLRQQGAQPHVHVYGDVNSSDVRIAREISRQEDIALEHVDKALVKPQCSYAEIVEQNFLRLDGLPSDGIFNNGSDLETRLRRATNGRLALNGGGGEIFRNFFYLPNRRFRRQDVLHAFYCQFSNKGQTSTFDRSVYLAKMEEKIGLCFAKDNHRLTRTEVEWLFPYFRCRYWMGRNNSLNCRFGHALTPLVNLEISLQALQIPLSLKNFGLFEAEMLRRIDPGLAAYSSSYGHSFANDPPLSSRAIGHANIHRPIWLRARSFVLKQQVRRSTAPTEYLSSQRLRSLLQLDSPGTANYFHHDRITDPGQLQRVWTTEYLLQRLGV